MDRAVEIQAPCRICGCVVTLTLPESGYKRFREGELIQSAMPEVSASDREMLISGVCAKCWKEMEEEMEDIDDDLPDDEELGIPDKGEEE